MPNDTNTADDAVGVQELIDQLKTDGVSRGQEEAESLVAHARREAVTIVDQAKEDAEKIVADAREEAKRLEENGKQQLQLAGRDASLTLKEEFEQEFQRRLGKLVDQSLRDHELLKRLILEVGGRAIPDREAGSGGKLLVAAGEDNAAQAELDGMVAGITADMLRDGMTVEVDDQADEAGVRVQLQGGDVEVDLTSETVTALLMRFVAPRFRAIIDPKS